MTCPDVQEIEIQNVALEVLQVLVSKCGSLMRSDHERLSEPLVALLETRRTSAKKRSIQCLGSVFMMGLCLVSMSLHHLRYSHLHGQLELLHECFRDLHKPV